MSVPLVLSVVAGPEDAPIGSHWHFSPSYFGASTAEKHRVLSLCEQLQGCLQFHTEPFHYIPSKAYLSCILF